jgi:hypothetical protein
MTSGSKYMLRFSCRQKKGALELDAAGASFMIYNITTHLICREKTFPALSQISVLSQSARKLMATF